MDKLSKLPAWKKFLFGKDWHGEKWMTVQEVDNYQRYLHPTCGLLPNNDFLKVICHITGYFPTTYRGNPTWVLRLDGEWVTWITRRLNRNNREELSTKRVCHDWMHYSFEYLWERKQLLNHRKGIRSTLQTRINDALEVVRNLPSSYQEYRKLVGLNANDDVYDDQQIEALQM